MNFFRKIENSNTKFTVVLYFGFMKKMFVLGVAMLFVTQLSAQQISMVVRIKFPLTPAVAGNPIKVTQTHTNKLRSGGELTKYVTLYDTAGMIVSSEHYNVNGALEYKREVKNDAINKRIESDILTFYRPNDVFIDTNYYTYDNKGFLIRSVEKFGDSSRVTEYTNDEKGFPVMALLYDTKGKLWRKEIAKYKLNKNEMKLTVYAAQGKKIYSSTQKIDFSKPKKGDNIKYNEHGHRIAYVDSFKGSHPKYKVAEYVYDQKGNWTSMKWYVLVPNPFGKEVKQLDSEATREYIYRD